MASRYVKPNGSTLNKRVRRLSRESACLSLVHRSPLTTTNAFIHKQSNADSFLHFSKLDNEDYCCVRESRCSIQYTKTGRIPNVMTVKLGLNQSKDNNLSCDIKNNNIEYLRHKVIAIHLMYLMTFKEYLRYLLLSKRIYNPKLLEKKLCSVIMRSGISHKMREKYWIAKCKIKETKRRAIHGFRYYACKKCRYATEIEKDVGRTFELPYANKENIERLRTVLNAFATRNPEVGYTQGLNFITGYLLTQFSNEVKFNKRVVNILDTRCASQQIPTKRILKGENAKTKDSIIPIR